MEQKSVSRRPKVWTEMIIQKYHLIHTAVSFASFFLTTPVERRLNPLFIGADSTEMMQDYPLHVSVTQVNLTYPVSTLGSRKERKGYVETRHLRYLT